MRLRSGTEFRDETEALARFAGAMAHPARVEVVKLLMERGPLCCSELVAELPLAQATVSQHLRILEREGLVVGREAGVRIEYHLQVERLKTFCRAFQQTLSVAEAE